MNSIISIHPHAALPVPGAILNGMAKITRVLRGCKVNAVIPKSRLHIGYHRSGGGGGRLHLIKRTPFGLQIALLGASKAGAQFAWYQRKPHQLIALWSAAYRRVGGVSEIAGLHTLISELQAAMANRYHRSHPRRIEPNWRYHRGAVYRVDQHRRANGEPRVRRTYLPGKCGPIYAFACHPGHAAASELSD